MLTAVDDESITYDAIGNPTSYYNGTRWNFTWEHGRQLASATNGTTSVSYTYDADGLRTSKTVGTTKFNYWYAGGKLLRMTFQIYDLDFFYDADGNPYSVLAEGVPFYYITNLQGDVLQIVDASGNPVVNYTYDPYGKVLSVTGSMADTLGADNPLRYRGYVYDTELGMYYLQSRYYDPELCRFINADVFASTGQGVLGHNMFAYCRNNPIFRKDALGTDDICVTDPNDDENPLNDMGTVYRPGGAGGGGNSTSSNSPGSGNTGYSYSPPAGGGGVTSQIKVGNVNVSFGHGGRHADISDISGLEDAIAHDVVTKPPTSGYRGQYDIFYSGNYYTYRYWTIGPADIRVGTYFYKVSE